MHRAWLASGVLVVLAFVHGGAAFAGTSCPERSDAYHAIIKDAAAKTGVCAAAIAAVIHTESCFRPEAKAGTSSATGMMQLIRDTARSLGLKVTDSVDERLDARKNITAGAQYLKQMLDLGRGSLDVALAGYYNGPLFVLLWGGVPPTAMGYAQKVCGLLPTYEKRLGVTCPATYCANLGQGRVATDVPIRIGVGDKVVEFANVGVVERLYKAKQLRMLYRFEGKDRAYYLAGDSGALSVPVSQLDTWRGEGCLAQVGSSPEVPNALNAGGEAIEMYALLSARALQDRDVRVTQPTIVVAAPTGKKATKGDDDGLGAFSRHYLRQAYGGRLVAHDLVERVALATVEVWTRMGIHNPFIATLVRTRKIHDDFGRVSSAERQRDLGLLGLSAVVSNLDYGRKGDKTMKALLDDTRKALEARFSKADLDRLRFESTKNVVRIELRDDTDEGRREIAARRGILEKIGVVKPGGKGIPMPVEVAPAPGD